MRRVLKRLLLAVYLSAATFALLEVGVRVFNFGASAYSVRVMEATLRRRMLAVEPNLVLLAIIPADFNLSRTPKSSRPKSSARAASTDTLPRPSTDA